MDAVLSELIADLSRSVHGENRDEGDDCPDLDSHTATVGASTLTPAEEHSGFPAKCLGLETSHGQHDTSVIT